MQTIEIKRPAKVGGVNNNTVYIGTVVHLATVLTKLQTKNRERKWRSGLDLIDEPKIKRGKAALNIINCSVCGMTLMQKASTQTTCSRSCSVKLSNKKRIENNEMRKMQSLG